MAFPLSCRVAAGVVAISIGLAGPALGATGPRQTLMHDGIARTYVLTVPDAAPAEALLPLVIVLHGGGGNAFNAVQMTNFDRKAEEEGFVAVFPDGTGRTQLLTWNAVHCCSYAMNQGIDDVGFIAALIDHLVATERVDPARVYFTGMSNGAMMSHVLGTALPGKIAAIGPVVGGLFGDEPVPAAPVPALIINGAEDLLVRLEGGPVGDWRLIAPSDGTPLMPAAHQAAFWSAANGCAAEPERIETAVAFVERYACPAGGAVEYHIVKDNGHAWPGGRAGTARGDAPTEALDATDLLWAFFATQARVAAPAPAIAP